MAAFTHLHVHSEYSLLDGCARISPLVMQARALGFESLALTDHGGAYGLVSFYREAEQVGIRPILGAELYLEPEETERSPYHLPLLALDNQGYRNLLQLISLAHLDGFRKKPLVKWEWLTEHAKGLVALSGCLQGEIPRLILSGDLTKARRRIMDYRSVFGECFFLEMQRHGLPDEERVIAALSRLSAETRCRCVATNDVHYLKKSDAQAHDLLLAVQTLSTIHQTDRLRMQSSEYELKSGEQMAKLFADHPQACQTAAEVAEACRVKLEFGTLRLPDFPIPQGETAGSFLQKLASQGLRWRFGQPTDEVWRRLNYELKTIIDLDLAAYFLIVQDIIAFAKREGIPVGPGRGSSVGSLVAYALGITEINPLEFGLLFERFLNPERKGMPDIDIDLCHRGRARVLEYVRLKYGRDHVAHLGAFVTLCPRAVVRDVGRALGIAYEKTDRTAKAVPYFARSIDAALAESPALQALQGDSDVRTILAYGRSLEGLPRHMTQHAAGVVVTREAITNYLALQRAGGEEIITQAEMGTVEELGLLKIDLLGLRYLTVIRDTLNFLKQQGQSLTEEEIPTDDPAVYAAISRGDTVGTFQLESGGMRRLLRQYKPENLEDIIAILALYRPGPLNSGMVETFIKRRHGKEPVTYLHPSLEPVLKETYGVILYQEQVMETARVLAGYTLGQADLLRRAVSKRDPQAMAKERDVFTGRACGRGVPRGIAHAIFDLIQEFGHYGFAKAHSAAYALNAYRTVYLKVHFPVAYHAALLSLNWGVEERFPRYLAEARQKGITLLLPDINLSTSLFRPEKCSIRSGLVMVRDLGQKGIQAITEARISGKFTSLRDLLDRTDRKQLTRRALENLIRVGACDGFGISRPQLLFNLQSWLRQPPARVHPGQAQLGFDDMTDEFRQEPFLNDYPPEVQWELERELLGYYLTRHPLEIFWDYLSGLKLDYAESLREEEKDQVLLCGLVGSLRSHRTRRGERMLFAVLEDLTGLADLVIFPKVLARFGHLLLEKEPLLVWGKADTTDEQTSVVVEGIRRVRDEKRIE